MTIPIRGDLHAPDPVPRRRQPAEGGNAAGKTTSTQGGEVADRVAILHSSPDVIKSYVQSLRTMHPVDLHKVEDLRERIRSGEYQADPDEMAGYLAEILDRQQSGNRGA